MSLLGVVLPIFVCISSSIVFYLFQGQKISIFSNLYKMIKQDSAEQLFEEFWEWRLQNSPEFASSIGIHRFDDKLESYSLNSFESRQIAAQEFLKRAKMLLNDTHEKKSLINLKLLIGDLEMFLDGMNVKGFLFPINNLEGVHIEFERIVSYMAFNNIDDYQKLFARYQAFPKQVDEIIELMKEGIRQGMANHMYSMNHVHDQLSKLQVPYEKSSFYSPFLKFPASISKTECEALQLKAKAIITDVLLPAFKKLQSFIENEYSKAFRPSIGVHSLPGGKAFYQQCLRFHLSLDLTPENIHQIGLEEVKRISDEMKLTIQKMDLNISAREFSEKLRNDKGFFFSTKDDLVEAYKGILNIIRPKLPQVIKSIPTLELSIRSMPESMSSGPLAYYLAGTPDGSRPGTFYVNTANVKSSPKYEMMSLSLHEGEPGHHLQASYMMEMKNIPDFMRYIEDRKYSDAPSRFPLHTAYLEGWGLYSEYLGKELDLYDDPYFHYGYLSQEIFRACRLVVDTGMHALGWSREKAIAFMMENTAASQKNVESEINRYITWPGQACAYKVGEMKIKMLRNRAEDTLGIKFDVREFHEVVLQNVGPLTFLEKQVDNYIQSLKI